MDFITLLSGDWEALLFSFDGESGTAHSRVPVGSSETAARRRP